jgi:hypothetical protein
VIGIAHACTAEVLLREGFQMDLPRAVAEVESQTEKDLDAAEIALKEFLSHSSELIEKKKEAQRQIWRIIQELRQVEYKNLVVPGNVKDFEDAWGHFYPRAEELKRHAAAYSFCLNAFADIMVHELNTIKKVNVDEIIRRVERQNAEFQEASAELELSVENVAHKLFELLAECRKEVERYAQMGGARIENNFKVILAQSISDFMIFYENVRSMENRFFHFLGEFIEKKAKVMDRADLDLEKSKEFLRHNRLDRKDIWNRVTFQPHMKVIRTVLVAGTVASFFAGSLGLVGGAVVGRRLSRVLSGVRSHKAWKITQKAAEYAEKYDKDLGKSYMKVEDVPA